MSRIQKAIWVLLRLCLGWTFLWAFMDKLWGLGYATEPAKSWLEGGSPTKGFLSFATTGPFADAFQSIAGLAWVDWLFMLGLLLIGVALILGVGVRVAGYAGALLMLFMWLAVLPKENNPFMDDHIVYALVLLGLAHARAGQWFGFGSTRLVKALPWMQ